MEVFNGSAAEQGKSAEDWLASCEIAVEATRMPVGTIATYLRGDAQAWRIATGKAAMGNNATFAVIKNVPCPRREDLSDQLPGATIFTSIDLQSAYHQVRLKPEDVPKTAFTTSFGLFECTVLCFGLRNAPATFCVPSGHSHSQQG